MEMCAHEYELTDPKMYTKSVSLKIHQKFQEIQRDKYEYIYIYKEMEIMY